MLKGGVASNSNKKENEMLRIILAGEKIALSRERIERAKRGHVARQAQQ